MSPGAAGVIGSFLCVPSKGIGGKINGMNITKVKTGGGFQIDSLLRCGDRGGTVTIENMESVMIIALLNGLAFLADVRQDSSGMMEK